MISCECLPYFRYCDVRCHIQYISFAQSKIRLTIFLSTVLLTLRALILTGRLAMAGLRIKLPPGIYMHPANTMYALPLQIPVRAERALHLVVRRLDRTLLRLRLDLLLALSLSFFFCHACTTSI